MHAKELTLVKQDGGARFFLGAEERTGRFFKFSESGSQIPGCRRKNEPLTL